MSDISLEGKIIVGSSSIVSARSSALPSPNQFLNAKTKLADYTGGLGFRMSRLFVT